MKKIGLIFLLILFVMPAVSAEISVRLKGGLTYISPTDYNEAIKGRNAYLIETVAVPPMRGSLSPFHLGWNLGGEVVWHFKKDFSLGFSGGYTRFATDDQLIYQYPTTSPTLLFGGTTNVKTSVAAIPLILKVHYARPLIKTVMLTAGLGPGIYFCSVHYNYDFAGGYMGATDWNETQAFVGHKITLGFEGEVGLEIPLAKKIFAEVNIGGRFAKLSDIKGDYSDVGTSDRGPYNTQSSEGYFTVFDYERNGKAYRQYAFDNNLRPYLSNYHRGTISLSGLFMTFGIRVAL